MRVKPGAGHLPPLRGGIWGGASPQGWRPGLSACAPAGLPIRRLTPSPERAPEPEPRAPPWVSGGGGSGSPVGSPVLHHISQGVVDWGGGDRGSQGTALGLWWAICWFTDGSPHIPGRGWLGRRDRGSQGWRPGLSACAPPGLPIRRLTPSPERAPEPEPRAPPWVCVGQSVGSPVLHHISQGVVGWGGGAWVPGRCPGLSACAPPGLPIRRPTPSPERAPEPEPRAPPWVSGGVGSGSGSPVDSPVLHHISQGMVGWGGGAGSQGWRPGLSACAPPGRHTDRIRAQPSP
jgi:hypothetical protein